MLGRSAEYYNDLAMISRMVQLRSDEGSLSGRPERWDVGYRYVIVRFLFLGKLMIGCIVLWLCQLALDAQVKLNPPRRRHYQCH